MICKLMFISFFVSIAPFVLILLFYAYEPYLDFVKCFWTPSLWKSACLFFFFKMGLSVMYEFVNSPFENREVGF